MPDLDAALRAGARNDKIEKNLDQQMINKATSILEETIHFVPSHRTYESVSESLKCKYNVLKGVIPADRPGPSETQSTGIESNLVFGPQLPTNTQHYSNRPTTSTANTANLHGALSRKEETDGIPEAATPIDTQERLVMEWDRALPPISVGLANLGNTCFLNSVLQVLSHTPPLVNYALKSHHVHECKAMGTGFCAICAFQGHVNLMVDRKRKGMDASAPRAVLSKMKAIMKSYQPGRQEDAHEFLRFFIESMQLARFAQFRNRKLDIFSKETNIISRIFGGFYRNLITCCSCQEKSATYDPFLDVSLEIKHLFKLEDALQNFTKNEDLSGSNAYKCLKCKTSVKARKRYSIHRPPSILTIHLKRFDHFGKIGKNVIYKEKIDLRPYMSNHVGMSVQYKLYAVIVHHGQTTHSGHYYAFVRGNGGVWHIMDDSRVAAVPRDTVFNQQAYLLFYQRLETPVVPVKPQERPRVSAPPTATKPVDTRTHTPTIINEPSKTTHKVTPFKIEKPIKVQLKPVRTGPNPLGVRPAAKPNKPLVPYEDDDDSPSSSRSDSPKTQQPVKKETENKETYNVFKRMHQGPGLYDDIPPAKVQKVSPAPQESPSPEKSVKIKIKLDKEDKNKGTVEMLSEDSPAKESNESPRKKHKKHKKKHRKRHRESESEEGEIHEERHKRHRRSSSASPDKRENRIRHEADIVEGLKADGGRGYGHNVGGWDGKASSLDRAERTSRHSSYSSDEETHKAKKHKYRSRHESYDRRSEGNVFQQQHDRRGSNHYYDSINNQYRNPNHHYRSNCRNSRFRRSSNR